MPLPQLHSRWIAHHWPRNSHGAKAPWSWITKSERRDLLGRNILQLEVPPQKKRCEVDVFDKYMNLYSGQLKMTVRMLWMTLLRHGSATEAHETTVMWVSVTQEPEVNRVTSGPEETEMTIQDSTSLEKTSRWTKPLFVRILLFKSWSFISINPLLYRLVVFPFSWGCQDISGQMWTDEMLFAYMWHGANLTSNHWSLKQRMSWALLQTASSCLKNLPLAVERVRVWKGWPSCIVVGWDGWMWWSRQLAQHGMKLDACEMHRSQVFDFSYRNQWVQICRSSWGAHSLHHFCLKFEEIFAWTYDIFIYIYYMHINKCMHIQLLRHRWYSTFSTCLHH